MAYATSLLTQRWPNGRVPFRIGGALRGTPAEAEVRAAIETWRSETHLEFDETPRRWEPCLIFTDDHDHSDTRCRAAVGYLGVDQYVFCDVGASFDRGSLRHEIGHAIGLYHEHQRPDRDQHVTLASSLTSDANYRIVHGGTTIGDYDACSLMHYSFGKVKPREQPPCGSANRAELSKTDVRATTVLYPLTRRWSSRWSTWWSTLVPFSHQGRTCLFEYKRGAGTAVIDEVVDPERGVVERWRDTWSGGWTHIVPFEMGGRTYLFEYRASTGEVVIDRVDSFPWRVREVWRGRWSRGWSHIGMFVHMGHPHLFEYRASDGTVVIDRIRDDLRGVTEQWRGRWSRGWSHVCVYSRGGTGWIVRYRQATGSVGLYRVGDDARGLLSRFSTRWSPGWTHIVPFIRQGLPHLFEYKTGTMEAVIDWVSSRKVEELGRTLVGPTWTEFAPFEHRQGTHVLRYRAHDGAVAIDRVNTSTRHVARG